MGDADSALILCTCTTAPTTYGDFGADISCKPSAYSSGASTPLRHKTRAPKHKNEMLSLPKQHWGKPCLTEISLHVFWTHWKIILQCFGFRVHKIVTSYSSSPVEVWATMMKIMTISPRATYKLFLCFNRCSFYWYQRIFRLCLLRQFIYTWQHTQGGSNMTGTDLYVNKPHCAAAVRPWESEATTSTLPPA